MKREIFEEKYGKLGSNAVYIDLDEQKTPPEPVTAGWTDTQIRNKSLEEIDSMIASGDAGILNLTQTLDNEIKRIDDLRRIRKRKLEL